MATLAKAKLTDSVGVSSPPEEPDHWTDSTITSVKAYLRKTCCCPLVPVALLISTVAVGKCCPAQQAANSLADEVSVFFMTLKLETETLPADRPVEPEPTVVGLEAPQENE